MTFPLFRRFRRVSAGEINSDVRPTPPLRLLRLHAVRAARWAPAGCGRAAPVRDERGLGFAAAVPVAPKWVHKLAEGVVATSTRGSSNKARG
jgi:hypothetical protein